jgi:hypothetical protein
MEVSLKKKDLEKMCLSRGYGFEESQRATLFYNTINDKVFILIPSKDDDDDTYIEFKEFYNLPETYHQFEVTILIKDHKIMEIHTKKLSLMRLDISSSRYYFTCQITPKDKVILFSRDRDDFDNVFIAPYMRKDLVVGETYISSDLDYELTSIDNDITKKGE